ncbi:MAG: hypothetical protein ACE5KM_20685 [Planctomycetaceae bacterium]
MPNLPLHPQLHATTRLRVLASPASTAGLRDWLLLMSAGAIAAVASTLMDFHLRIPGHAILRAIFPMSVGLALVPRRGAGCVMGGAALVSVMGLRFAGLGDGGMSLGALTSLTAVGPLLDWSLRRPRTGWRQSAGFAVAGLTANSLAFGVRGTAKALAWDHGGGRPLAVWLPTAAVTYVVCGLLAGLLSGAILFYGPRRPGPDPPETRE